MDSKAKYNKLVNELIEGHSELGDFHGGLIVPTGNQVATVIHPQGTFAALLTLAIKDQNDFYGRIFGFPECCRKEFTTYMRTHPRPARSEEVMSHPLVKRGTGYIPCTECAKKSEFELIADITSARLHPSPFPQFKGDRDISRTIMLKVEELGHEYRLGRFQIIEL